MSLTPPLRPQHDFSYGPLDLPASYTPPDLGDGDARTESYSYSDDAELLNTVHPDSTQSNFNYDPVTGRLTSVALDSGEAITPTYNAAGQITQLSRTKPGETTETLGYVYDGSATVQESWAGTVSGSIEFNRQDVETLGTLHETVRGSGGAPADDSLVSYSFDGDNRLSSAGPVAISYEANTGFKSGHVIGDGGSFDVSVDYAYNASFGELVSREATIGAAPTPAFSSAYTYDVQGRISFLTETNDGQASERSFSYNNRGWLTEVRDGIGDLIAAYSFDDNGNRLTGPGIALGDAVYDDHDQLLTYGNTSFTYDENGYVIEKSTPPQTTSYVYDDLGSLSEVITPTGEQIRYIYDAADRRIAKTKEGVFVEGYLYGPTGRPTAVVDDQGRLIQRFIYAEGLCPTAMETTGGMQYAIVSDHLCSIRQIINLADGSVVQAMDYDEYGNVLRDTNPGFTPFGYAGGIYDPDTALVHFGAREYDPSVGRFLQRDPAGFPDGGNRYSYTDNEPMNRVDPWGKSWSDFADAWSDVGAGYIDSAVGFVSSGVGNVSDFASDVMHQASIGNWTTVGLRAGEFVTGFFDGTIAGIIRDNFDLNGGIDVCSSAYRGGRFAMHVAVAVGGITALGKGAAKLAGRGALNPKIYTQLQGQLARDGSKSIHKALRSAEKTLGEHVDKLPGLKYPSQVKGTIKNVKNQIATLKKFIRDNNL